MTQRMAQAIEFHPYLHQAFLSGALTPQQAWDLDLTLWGEMEPTVEQMLLVPWINLVNSPASLLTEQ